MIWSMNQWARRDPRQIYKEPQCRVINRTRREAWWRGSLFSFVKPTDEPFPSSAPWCLPPREATRGSRVHCRDCGQVLQRQTKSCYDEVITNVAGLYDPRVLNSSLRQRTWIGVVLGVIKLRLYTVVFLRLICMKLKRGRILVNYVGGSCGEQVKYSFLCSVECCFHLFYQFSDFSFQNRTNFRMCCYWLLF